MFRETYFSKFFRYVAISAVVVLFAGVAFYSYKRIKLKRRKGPLIQENIKNKKYLDKRY